MLATLIPRGRRRRNVRRVLSSRGVTFNASDPRHRKLEQLGSRTKMLRAMDSLILDPGMLGAKLLAEYDVTRIRPAYGAGPHSRAMVLAALQLSGTDTTGPYLTTTSLTGISAGDDVTFRALVTPADNDQCYWIGDSTGNNGFFIFNLLSGATVFTRHQGGSDLTVATSGMNAGMPYVIEVTVHADGAFRRIRHWNVLGTLAENSNTTAAGASWSVPFDTMSVGRSDSNPGQRSANSWSEIGVWSQGAPSAGDTTSASRGDSGLTLDADNLIGFWPLDAERQGADVSGSGNDLSLVNSPGFAGSAVVLARDLSGNGFHARGAGGMTWAGSGNSRFLHGSGASNSYLLVPRVVAASPVGVELACAAATGSSAFRYFLGLIDLSAPANFAGIGGNFGTDGEIYCFVSDAGANGVARVAGAPAIGTWQVGAYRSASTSSHVMRVNGVDGTPLTTTVDPAGIDALVIGAYYPNAGHDGQQGRIVVTQTLDEAERKIRDRYLALPHGIAVA